MQWAQPLCRHLVWSGYSLRIKLLLPLLVKGGNYCPSLDQQLHQCSITKSGPWQPGDVHTAPGRSSRSFHSFHLSVGEWLQTQGNYNAQYSYHFFTNRNTVSKSARMRWENTSDSLQEFSFFLTPLSSNYKQAFFCISLAYWFKLQHSQGRNRSWSSPSLL